MVKSTLTPVSFRYRRILLIILQIFQKSSLSSLPPSLPPSPLLLLLLPSVCHPPPARPPARLLLQTQLRGCLDPVGNPHRRECELRRQHLAHPPINLSLFFLSSSSSSSSFFRPSLCCVIVTSLISHPPLHSGNCPLFVFCPLRNKTPSPFNVRFLPLNSLWQLQTFLQRLIRTGIDNQPATCTGFCWTCCRFIN